MATIRRSEEAQGRVTLAADVDGKEVATLPARWDDGRMSDLLGNVGPLTLAEGSDATVGESLLAEAQRILQRSAYLALYEGPGEAEAINALAQAGWSPLGTLPRGEKCQIVAGKYWGKALSARKAQPTIAPEMQHLAHQVGVGLNRPLNFEVDGGAPSLRSEHRFELESLSSEGYLPSLRHLRSSANMPQVLGLSHRRKGPMHYLLAMDYGMVAGGIGYCIDEGVVSVVECVTNATNCLRQLLEEFLRRVTEEHAPKTIEVAVSAYAPAMQRTMSEAGFAAVAYLPGAFCHAQERLDALIMARPADGFPKESGLRDTPFGNLEEVVSRGFATQRALPQLQDASRRLAILDGLSPEQVECMARACTLRTFESGDQLLTPGAKAQQMYFVLHGRIAIRMEPDGEDIAEVRPGEALGEIGFIANTPPTAHAFAKSTGEAAVFTADSFRELTRRRPDIGLIIYKNIALEIGKKLVRTNVNLVFHDKQS